MRRVARHTILAALVSAVVVLAAACGGDDLTVVPDHGSSFGQFRVELHSPSQRLADLDLKSTVVTFGSIRAIELRSTDDGGLSVVVQGSPRDGAVDVVVVDGDVELRSEDGFRYEPPKAPALRDWMAIGASYSQGVQGNGFSPHSQRMSPPAQIARAAGAYLGIPLLHDWLAPSATPKMIQGNCALKQADPSTQIHLLDRLKDPKTGIVSLRRARLDPTLQAHNVAVGGYRLRDVLDGGAGLGVVMENIITNPDAKPAQMLLPPDDSQVDLVERYRPDIVVSADLYGNDIGLAFFNTGNDLDLSKLDALPDFKRKMTSLIGRVAAAADHAFFANVPEVDLLPRLAEIRRLRLAAGQSVDAYDDKVDKLNTYIGQVNRALVEIAKKHPNIHVVDFAAEVERLAKTGVDAGQQHLVAKPFGGLFGLDNLHLTDTGYALLANLFIDTINRELGTSIPRIDLGDVVSQDRESPEALKKDPHTQKCVPDGAGKR